MSTDVSPNPVTPTVPVNDEVIAPQGRRPEPVPFPGDGGGSLPGPRDGPAGSPRRGWYAPLKDDVDFCLGLVLFVVTLPLVLVLMAVVKLTSKGPAIYTQERVGRGGRKFLIHKLRTMYDGCERGTGPRWASARDPRVTRFGRLLRRTHLDELPQLWDVLRGDMSLVGPRPERPEIIAGLEQAIPFYRDRELIRPGLTGLAQVQLPPDTDLAGVRLKLAHDLYYLRTFGPWLDLRILTATALSVVGAPWAFSCRALRIPTGPPIVESYEGLLASSRGAGCPRVTAEAAGRPQGRVQPADQEHTLV